MAAPAGAALRLPLLFRMLRVGELLALAVLLSWSSARAPSAAAAAARAAGSLLFSPRFVFVLGNAIVLLLLALSRRQDPSMSLLLQRGASSQTPEPTAAPPAVCFPPFTAPASMAMPADPVVPMAPAPPVAAAAAMATVFEEEEVAKPIPVPAAEAEEARRVVGNNRKARAPRRSRSEKMGRAASPEMMMPAAMMRRSESDNGRRRRSSATARDVGRADGRSWGKEDADEFRRTVEAFIARQTRFHLEEESSMAVVLPGAGAGALVVVE